LFGKNINHMRILVITQYFWPENFRINDLVTELSNRSHQVTVLTGVPNYPTGKTFPEFQKNQELFSRFGTVPVFRVPMLPRGKGVISLFLNYISFVFMASVVGIWKLRKESFDVIFVFGVSPVTVAIPAIIMKGIKKIPVALWVLDLWPESLESVGVIRSKLLLNMVGKLVSFIYRHCDLILGQSKSFISQIKKYSYPFTPVNYFPTWSDVSFEFSNIDPAIEIPKEEGTFNILFTGNIGEAQDFPAILNAAEILKENKNIRWIILGDGRKASWVKAEIERRGITNNFLMLGSFPLHRMPSFFKHASALLVCLKDEPIFSLTIPGKLQTYLAAGIPVLAMINGEGSEIIRESGAGLTCSAGDSTGLVEAIRQMTGMSNDALQEMGRLGKNFSLREFSRETLISQLIIWLERLSEVQIK